MLRLGEADDGEGRLVIDHQHGLDVLVRVLVAEARQRVDVEESDRIGAGRDTRDAGDRTGAGVDGDVEPFGLVVALVDGDEIGSGRAFEFPVEREFEFGLRACRCGRRGEHHTGDGGEECGFAKHVEDSRENNFRPGESGSKRRAT